VQLALPEPLPQSLWEPPANDADATSACEVTTGALASAEAVAAASLRQTFASPAPFVAWDHRRAPAHLDQVQRRFGLSASQTRALLREGMVVLETPTFDNYTDAFHEIFESELPMWVSVDAVLQAIYRSNATLMARIEETSAMPTLDRAIEAMQCGLAGQASRYEGETARDVDLYLTVARSLLAGKAMPSVLGVDEEAKKIVARAVAAQGIETLTLFGRERVVDFSAYRPRGYYELDNPDGPSLAKYFRAATWLSRLELNLVTYDCVSSGHGGEQTPREDRDALALADLMTRTGAAEDVAKLEDAWTLLAGRREDVSFTALAALTKDAQLGDLRAPDVDARLRALIGRRSPRTARTHFTAEGCSDLPAIATMLGARIVPDAGITRPLVSPEVPERPRLGAMDIAYALGHDRAKQYLARDLAEFATLGGALKKARAVGLAPLNGEDLYSAWLGAIRGLALTPAGSLPSVMRSPVFADLRLSSTVAAYGQLRHNYALTAAMTYDEGGCEIPDTFVEPAPAVYDALIEYAARGAAAMKRLEGPDRDATLTGTTDAYFARLTQTLTLLRAVGTRELANRPLPREVLRFLSMVVEATAGHLGYTPHPPTFTGWYFDLFRARSEAFETASFVADYYTSSRLSEAAYAGVKGVRLGIFIVDTAGVPRVVVGPVADAFEAHAPLPRLTDAQVSDAHADQPWALGYTPKSTPAPPLSVSVAMTPTGAARRAHVSLKAQSTSALGDVTLEIVDIHRHPIRAITHRVGADEVTFDFGEEKTDVYGVHVKVGEWQVWETGHLDKHFGPRRDAYASWRWGAMASAAVADSSL